MFTKRSLAAVLVLLVGIILLTGGCIPQPQPPVPVTHTITALAEEGGSIDPEGEVTVTEGADQTFQITPDEGYQILDVWVEGEWVGPVTTYTFENVQDDSTIHAFFTSITHPSAWLPGTYTIEASAGEGGSIDPVGRVRVTERRNQTFQITPDTGFEILDVTVDGESVGALAEYTFESVKRNHTIHAEFVALRTLTMTEPEGQGTVVPDIGRHNYPLGSVVTIQAFPADGWAFSHWVGDFEIVANRSAAHTRNNNHHTANPIDIIINEDTTIQAVFVRITHTITATAGAGGNITPAGTVTVAQGDNQTFTITPAEGYRIEDVLVDGESVGTVGQYTFENVQQDHTIHAEFKQIPPVRYTLTMQVAPVGGGTTTPAGGDHAYNEGAVVDITATPDDGYQFVSWTGDVADPESASTTVTMDSDKTVTANFEEIPPDTYTLTMQVNPEGGGTTDPAVGDHTYDENTVVPVEAFPETGYQFVSWTGDVADPDASATTVTMDGDKTVTANFEIVGPVHNITQNTFYDTIQEAIDDSNPADEIVVSAGTYQENILFDNKNITLRSTDPQDPAVVASTIIDGGGDGSVVTLTGGDASTLQGFTIRNGRADSGGGILVGSESHPTISGNTISGNTGIYGGGGISVWGSSHPTISGNTISGNSGGAYSGGGIRVVDSSHPTISGNTISGNTTDYGGGIHVSGSSNPVITGNTISGNRGRMRGGGINVGGSSHPAISGNTISGNRTAYSGGGIAVDSSSNPTVEDNAITDNAAVWYGGGILVRGSSNPTITGNTITGNTADMTGGGINVGGSSNPAITGNTITGNTAVIHGGGINVGGSSNPAISGNTISGNTAVSNGGGINVTGNSNPTVEDNAITDNTAVSDGGGIWVSGGEYLSTITSTVGTWPRDNCPPATAPDNTIENNTHQGGQTNEGANVFFEE